MKDNVRIYIISQEAYTDYSEKHNIKRVEDIPDNDFVDMAEEKGSVFTLKGFEISWNEYSQFMPYADDSYIRIICKK